jgi:hypothetical protein
LKAAQSHIQRGLRVIDSKAFLYLIDDYILHPPVPAAEASAEVSASTVINAAAESAAAAAAAAEAAVMEKNQVKHFGFFKKRSWTFIECGGAGNCFFYSILALIKIYKFGCDVVPLFKTHVALRKQVCRHIRDHQHEIIACDQPIMALLGARQAGFLSRMLIDGTYVEYEILCGFSHLVKVPVIVYSIHLRDPMVTACVLPCFLLFTLCR